MGPIAEKKIQAREEIEEEKTSTGGPSRGLQSREQKKHDATRNALHNSKTTHESRQPRRCEVEVQLMKRMGNQKTERGKNIHKIKM